jgi:hypothetical protein
MSVYRYVHTDYWQDDFILSLTSEEKFFYVYLLTNSKTKQCGIYELSKKVMVFETGYNIKTINKLLDKFKKYGKIKYSEKTKEIFLTKWLKHNRSNSPKVKVCIEKELKEIKTEEFIKEYQELCIEYKYSINTVSILNHKEKEKEKENKKKKKENKNKYFDLVYLTEKEHKTLIKEYGVENTTKFYKKLSNYKGAKGKKYKSDYKAILSWVIDAVISKTKKQFKNERTYKNEEQEEIIKGFYS